MEVQREEQRRIFKASRIWESNVWGAAVAGIGAGLLMTTVASILLWGTPSTNVRIFAIAWIFTTVLTLLALFPGNLIAAVPVAVEFEAGKGLWLIAPLKRLYIPLTELAEVRDSMPWQLLQEGIIVKLNKRHGLMKSFAVHWAFGPNGRQLARLIQREIVIRGEWPTDSPS